MFPHNALNKYFIVLDMSQNTASKEELVCCRACLSTDGRLFNIHEFELAEAFLRITEIPVSKDKLPQYLCSYCRTLLLKCVSFRAMCAQTQQKLIPQLLQGQLNIEFIHSLNQRTNPFLNLMSTEVEIVDCDPSEDTETIESAEVIEDQSICLKEEKGNIDTFDDIGDEPNIDIGDKPNTDIDENYLKIEIDKTELIDNIDDKNSDICYVISDSEETDEIQYDAVKDKVKISNESKDKKAEGRIYIKRKMIKTQTKKEEKEAEIRNLQNELNNLIKENELKLANKSEYNLEEAIAFGNLVKDMERRIRNLKRSLRSIVIPTANRSSSSSPTRTTNNKTFEKEYSVKVVVLTKEEQLAEVAARKTTANYLESPFKCEECFKGYGSTVAYENHVVRHNPSSGDYFCDICLIRFLDNSQRLRHLEAHRLKFVCTICNFVSRNRGQARQHQAGHAGKTYQCPHCGKSFIKRSSYLSHVRLTHPARNVACDVCGETFVSDKGLKMHKARTHSENIRCTVCFAKFASLVALNRHANTAGDHTDLWPCEQCGDNCASEEALLEHVGIIHPVESHRCDQCNMEFPSYQAYDTHILRKHLGEGYKLAKSAGKGPKRRQYKSSKTNDKKYICEQCGHISKSLPQFRMHQNVHLGVKPFVCAYCSKAFASKMFLICHIRTHTGERPFQCPSCPLAFTMKGNLDRHQKTAHLGIRDSLPCPLCAGAVTTAWSLRVHIRSKHGGQRWPKGRKRAKHAAFV